MYLIKFTTPTLSLRQRWSFCLVMQAFISAWLPESLQFGQGLLCTDSGCGWSHLGWQHPPGSTDSEPLTTVGLTHSSFYTHCRNSHQGRRVGLATCWRRVSWNTYLLNHNSLDSHTIFTRLTWLPGTTYYHVSLRLLGFKDHYF